MFGSHIDSHCEHCLVVIFNLLVMPNRPPGLFGWCPEYSCWGTSHALNITSYSVAFDNPQRTHQVLLHRVCVGGKSNNSCDTSSRESETLSSQEKPGLLLVQNCFYHFFLCCWTSVHNVKSKKTSVFSGWYQNLIFISTNLSRAVIFQKMSRWTLLFKQTKTNNMWNMWLK